MIEKYLAFHREVEERMEEIMADITALQAAVSELTTTVESATTKLREGQKPAQGDVDALTQAVQAEKQKLVEAGA